MSDATTRNAISFSGHFGGGDVDNALNPHFFALKKAFQIAGMNIPCDKIEEIGFVIRADGAIRQFNFEGAQNIDLNLRKRYITVDIGVPISRWVHRSTTEIGSYLIESMRQGVETMLSHLKEKGIKCAEDDVRKLFDSGAERYLQQLTAEEK